MTSVPKKCWSEGGRFGGPARALFGFARGRRLANSAPNTTSPSQATASQKPSPSLRLNCGSSPAGRLKASAVRAATAGSPSSAAWPASSSSAASFDSAAASSDAFSASSARLVTSGSNRRRGLRPPGRGTRSTDESGTADPWIEDGVEGVGEEVDRDETHRDEHHHTLHHQVVALVDRRDEQGADARQAIDVLDDDGSCQQSADAQPDQARERDARGPQGVPNQDAPTGEALRSGHQDELRLERRDEVAPQHTGEQGELPGGKGQCRKEDGPGRRDDGRVDPAGQGEPRRDAARGEGVHLHGEDVEEQLAEHEGGEGEQRQARRRDELVEPAVRPHRTGDRHGDGDRERHDLGHDDQLDGDRQAGADGARHVLVADRRLAEVAVEGVPEPEEVADVDRMVEAELGRQLGARRRITCRRAEDRVDRTARQQVDQEEREDGDGDHDGEQPYEACPEIPQHLSVPASPCSAWLSVCRPQLESQSWVSQGVESEARPSACWPFGRVIWPKPCTVGAQIRAFGPRPSQMYWASFVNSFQTWP